MVCSNHCLMDLPSDYASLLCWLAGTNKDADKASIHGASFLWRKGRQGSYLLRFDPLHRANSAWSLRFQYPRSLRRAKANDRSLLRVPQLHTQPTITYRGGGRKATLPRQRYPRQQNGRQESAHDRLHAAPGLCLPKGCRTALLTSISCVFARCVPLEQ